MNRIIRHGCQFALCSGLGISLVAGCAQKTGKSDGRLPMEDVSLGDRRSPAILDADLISFTDQASEFVARELVNLSEVRSSQTKRVLTIGDIRNQTYDTPTGDVNRALSRMRAQLNNSELIRSHFIVTADRGRVRRLNENVRGESPPDLLQEGRGDANDPTRFAANVTYVLCADLCESVRGSRRRYTAVFSLIRLDNGVVVLERSFDGSRVVE